ncbi:MULTISPECIES: AI-2E family transporter [unclassified Arcicella]|uniref:AI-2E family transporter n=1 Tax=unclassified Arcicella TaxID=2644986 RepID=UPI00285D79E5|nr:MULTISPECIES: AI-2E family transporter [unclassified Arcicella]MDR6560343.1 putative PurR-regulated permease PerM [Arcicella sp. BE51]MDR6810051.1 putative PurR-regulated permease PerM [Arcicella sp. BE140]MDR6821400.1 putative PurR-regulated permease PerM [Arcicella sp. BE139]
MAQRFPFILKFAFSLISVTILVYWLVVLQDILVPFYVAVILAMALFPISNWLEKIGLGRVAGVTIALILFLVISVGVIWLASTQIASFSEMFPQLEKRFTDLFLQCQRWTEQHFHVGRKMQNDKLRQYATGMLSSGGVVFTSALSMTGNMLGNLSLIPIYMFFLLYYRDFFKLFFYKVFKNVSKYAIDTVLTKIYEVVHSYLKGLITVTFIVGSLNTIGLLALGIDYAIFFGFLAAALLVIPFIGILIGSILPIIMALITKDSPMYAVGVAGVFIFVQFLEGNFITPQVVGSKISINGLVAIIALLLGSALWGIAGMALSLPTVAILKVLFDSITDLKPFGFLLGEPDHNRIMEEKKKKMREFVPELVETINETTEDVKSLVKGKKKKADKAD